MNVQQQEEWFKNAFETREKELKEVDGKYLINGDEEKESAIRHYVEYLQFYYYSKEDNLWFHPILIPSTKKLPFSTLSKQLGYLLSCGADLMDALKYYGLFDDCGQILGELFIGMGDWICDIFKTDKSKKWKNFVLAGMEWALACRPREVLQNGVLIKDIINHYDIENALMSSN
ncbi:Uncharacterized protein QTN25_009195 [Entamoeba marina]